MFLVLLVTNLGFGILPAIGQDPIQGLEEYIEAKRQAWDVPGLSVAIVSQDNVLLNKGFGVLHVDKPDLVTANSRFAIASNTKAFTTAAMAILVERGQLNWDDRVQKHLPDFQLYDPLVSADLRVKDLVCHRSGLGTFSGDLLWYGTPFSPAEIVGKARYLPKAGTLREHYGYSNLMFLAAGEVIAKVSGKSWAEFVASEIVQPLGMSQTLFSTTDLVGQSEVAVPHKTLPDQNLPLEWYNWDAMMAAGGIISSTTDMSKWLQLQLRRGKIDDQRRLFSESSSETMWSPATVIPVTAKHRELFPSSHFRAYGLGWVMMDYRGVKVLSHGGGYDGMYSCVMLVPESDLGIIILTNSMTSLPTALAHQIVERFLEPNSTVEFTEVFYESFKKDRVEFYDRIRKATEIRTKGTAPSHSLEAYCGTYVDRMYGEAQVILENGNLVLRLMANKDLVADLTHLQYDTFKIDWRKEFAWFEEGACKFDLDFAGNVSRFKMDVPNDDLWFDELDYTRVVGGAK